MKMKNDIFEAGDKVEIIRNLNLGGDLQNHKGETGVCTGDFTPQETDIKEERDFIVKIDNTNKELWFNYRELKLKLAETIKISGFTSGDIKTRMLPVHFELDTGLTQLDDEHRQKFRELVVRGIWECYDDCSGGILHYEFSDTHKSEFIDGDISAEIIGKNYKDIEWIDSP